MSNSIKKVNASTFDGIKSSQRQDLLAVEEPLEINIATTIDGKRSVKTVSITMCTPGNTAELAAGFLFTEGLLTNRSQISDTWLPDDSEFNTVTVDLAEGFELNLQGLDRNFYTTSSCGVCGKTSIAALKTKSAYSPHPSSRKIRPDVLTSLPATLRDSQTVFDKTGGLHASALFAPHGELMCVREDVGRHNALDKLIGHFFLADSLPLSESILLVSGRASFELIQKAGMAGIPIMAAVGAPSSLAVELADELGITLIGFLRGSRFNVYTHPERIDP